MPSPPCSLRLDGPHTWHVCGVYYLGICVFQCSYVHVNSSLSHFLLFRRHMDTHTVPVSPLRPLQAAPRPPLPGARTGCPRGSALPGGLRAASRPGGKCAFLGCVGRACAELPEVGPPGSECHRNSPRPRALPSVRAQTSPITIHPSSLLRPSRPSVADPAWPGRSLPPLLLPARVALCSQDTPFPPPPPPPIPAPAHLVLAGPAPAARLWLWVPPQTGLAYLTTTCPRGRPHLKCGRCIQGTGLLTSQ